MGVTTWGFGPFDFRVWGCEGFGTRGLGWVGKCGLISGTHAGLCRTHARDSFPHP